MSVKTGIQYICNYENRKNYTLHDIAKIKPYDLISQSEESAFTMLINGKIFFHTEGFNTLEFLHQLAVWETEKGDFKYICIDTDENPLISFIKSDGGYSVSSPWQNFICTDKFSFENLISAKNILNNSGEL